jgi:DMSO/TMAO reductase YedYZ molybdopterin-dependent catalytic subunit
MKKTRNLSELLEDPDRAQAELWSRRGFLRGAQSTALLAIARAGIPFFRFLPAGLLPVAIVHAQPGEVLAEKPGLRLLSDRPLVVETPAHLLDDDITPAERLFVRNNGLPPESVDAESWRLTVEGESIPAPKTFSIADLRRNFATFSYQLQLECAGNGRSEFRPRAPGTQWTTGAVGCLEWTGVRLRDVLEACGIQDDAVYVAFRGADRHLSGDPNKAPISRGVPMSKALEDEALIAWAMNGEAIPSHHGAPLRLAIGGWPGSVSGKWLTTILVRNRVHDGEKMLGGSYRMPCKPVAPGEQVADEEMCIIESMPVRSLITAPESGARVAAKRPLQVRGHAWAGDLQVKNVETSIDFGATWQSASVEPPPNRLAWQRWRSQVVLPEPGYYELWVRATDALGRAQPMLVPGWNPEGYLNNATHRVALLAG